jgi:crotonobetainyl-CoA:carnitine CoA-transferase CaiB-like acyl-CoA transferase
MLLDGMRILSFCHYLHGPAATQYLADMGADVIKIEPPGGPLERRWSGGNAFVDGVSSFYLCANRNKRSLAVNLKHPEAKEVIERLIEQSDVLIENFRPGVLDRLGFGLDAARKLKPDIIYVSASGYGTTGPMRDAPGQDLLVQARCGLAAATGEYGARPTAIGNAAVDQHGAALMAMGVAAAYAKKLRTGEGTRIDACLLNAGIDLQTEPLTAFMCRPDLTRDVFRRDYHLASWYHPAPYGVYRMADGFVAIAMNGTELKLAEILQNETLVALCERDLIEARDAFAEELARELEERRLDDLVSAFHTAGIWYAPVQDYEDLRTDPQLDANQVFREVAIGDETATLVNHPLRYDGEVPQLRHIALRCGEDGRKILTELGFDLSQIDDLFSTGALFEAEPQGVDGGT